MVHIPEEKTASELGYRNIFEAAHDGLIVYDLQTGVVVDANPAACAMHGYTREEFVGLDSKAFMIPASHDLFLQHLTAAENTGGFEALVVHVRKDGMQLHVEVRRSLVRYQGRSCLLSVIRDVSHRLHEEKIQSGQMQARMREQAALLAISHLLASTLELQPGLILDQLRLIIEFNHAGLFSLEASDLIALAIRGTESAEAAKPLRIHLTVPENLVSLFNEHRPIRISDVWGDDLQAQFLRSLLVDEAAELLKGMRSWMWVPLAVRGRIIGGIGVAHKNENHFTPHHADLALSVANQAAITMINAELYGQAQTLAVLEERQRLARNLHDAVNQSLFSAGLIAEVLPRLWDQDQELARKSLEDLRRLTRGAMAEMRALLAELRPSTLIDADLSDLLNLLGNAFTGRTNVPVQIKVIGEGQLPAEVQVAVYRVCQEALNNIVKHAEASKVELSFTYRDDGIELNLRDDGKGFDLQRTVSGHYGLGMMQERVDAIHANLSITSQPGRGTNLRLRWTETKRKDT
jgi:two-component system nitrate/nitrite sensor histidine kinase NarX